MQYDQDEEDSLFVVGRVSRLDPCRLVLTKQMSLRGRVCSCDIFVLDVYCLQYHQSHHNQDERNGGLDGPLNIVLTSTVFIPSPVTEYSFVPHLQFLRGINDSESMEAR